MVVKTFRGLLADGGQEQIRLQTIKGKVGYRIVKLQLFPYQPGHTVNYESVIQIFTHKQSTVPASAATVDFTDSTFLIRLRLTRIYMLHLQITPQAIL